MVTVYQKEKHIKDFRNQLEKPLREEEVEDRVREMNGWAFQNLSIKRVFMFRNYAGVREFVHEICELSNKENHHPSVKFNYDVCIVKFRTHKKNAITGMDLICAEKLNSIFDQITQGDRDKYKV